MTIPVKRNRSLLPFLVAFSCVILLACDQAPLAQSDAQKAEPQAALPGNETEPMLSGEGQSQSAAARTTTEPTAAAESHQSSGTPPPALSANTVQKDYPNIVNKAGLGRYTPVVSHQAGAHLSDVSMFSNAAGERVLAFARSDRAKPFQSKAIFYQTRKGNQWQSAQKFEFADTHVHALFGVAERQSKAPMFVFGGDNTNYRQLLNLPDGPIRLEDLEHPIEELRSFTAQNTQLFYSILRQGQLPKAYPINGTRQIFAATVVQGLSGRVVIIFSKDTDGKLETTVDRELFFVSFSNSQWSAPVQLTANQQFETLVQPQHYDGKIAISYLQDADGSLQTEDDVSIKALAIDLEGNVISAPHTLNDTNPYLTKPIFSRRQGIPVLLWPVHNGESRNILFESSFNGSWSNPQSTGIKVSTVRFGQFVDRNGSSTFLYEDSGNLYSAFFRDNQWYYSGLVQDFQKSSFDVKGLRVIENDDTRFKLLVSGSVFSEDQDNTDSLFEATYTLGPDFTFRRSYYIQNRQALELEIVNRGYLSTGAYSLDIKQGSHLLKTIGPFAEILPNSSVKMQVPLEILKNPSDIQVMPRNNSPLDIEPQNNVGLQKNVFKVDYAITSLDKVSDTRFSARIRDLTKIGTEIANVQARLVRGATSMPIKTGIFNPNDIKPFVFDIPALPISQAYNVVVEINHDKKVYEDNLINNQYTFEYQPGIDIAISNFEIDWRGISITLENKGVLPASEIDFLLTTNPEFLAELDESSAPSALVYQTVDFVDDEAKLKLSSDILEDQEGYYLYLVVNPVGRFRERNRENNRVQIAKHLHGTGQAPVLSAKASMYLGLNSHVKGDIVVNSKAQRRWLGFMQELILDNEATVQGDAHADSIRMDRRSQIHGNVYLNDMKRDPNKTEISGTLNSPLTLPVIEFDEFSGFESGMEDVTVRKSEREELTPNSYRDLKLQPGQPRRPTTLVLTGGEYTIRNLKLSPFTRLECRNACKIYVKERLLPGFQAYVGPEEGAEISSQQVELLIAGQNGKKGHRLSVPKACTFGANNLIVASVFAPNGTIEFKHKTTAHGRFQAKHIRTGIDTNIILGDARLDRNMSKLGQAFGNTLDQSGSEFVAGLAQSFGRENEYEN